MIRCESRVVLSSIFPGEHRHQQSGHACVEARVQCALHHSISSMYDHLWDHDNIHTVVYVYIYIFIYIYTYIYIYMYIYNYIYIYNVLYMIYDVCLYVCCCFFALSFVWMGMDNISLFVCFRHCFMNRRIVLWCLMGNVQRCDTLKCSHVISWCVFKCSPLSHYLILFQDL